MRGAPTRIRRSARAEFVTPLADPAATAKGVAELLLDPGLRARRGAAIRRRTERYYDKKVVDRIYRELYEAHLALPDRPMRREAA